MIGWSLWTSKKGIHCVCWNIQKIISSRIITEKWGNCLRLEPLFYLSGNRARSQILYFEQPSNCRGKTLARNNPTNVSWQNCLKIFFWGRGKQFFFLNTDVLIIRGMLVSQFPVLNIIVNKPFKGHSKWAYIVFTVVGLISVSLKEKCSNTVFVLRELILVNEWSFPWQHHTWLKKCCIQT